MKESIEEHSAINCEKNEAKKFLASPVLATVMLYWAAYFDEIPIATMVRLLELTEAYPEGPVWNNEFTPIHAACRSKNADKLKILLEEFTNLKRYDEFEKNNKSKAKNVLRRREPWTEIGTRNMMVNLAKECNVMVGNKKGY